MHAGDVVGVMPVGEIGRDQQVVVRDDPQQRPQPACCLLGDAEPHEQLSIERGNRGLRHGEAEQQEANQAGERSLDGCEPPLVQCEVETRRDQLGRAVQRVADAQPVVAGVLKRRA